MQYLIFIFWSPFFIFIGCFLIDPKEDYFRLCNQTTNVWLNSQCSRPMYEWCYRSFFHQMSLNSILVVVRNHFFCEIGAPTPSSFGLKKSIHLHMTLFLNIARSFMYVWKQFEICHHLCSRWSCNLCVRCFKSVHKCMTNILYTLWSRTCSLTVRNKMFSKLQTNQ